jgi:hypothetical protein
MANLLLIAKLFKCKKFEYRNMDSIMKKVIMGKSDEETHKYFIRFGKGSFERRFLISYNKSADKIKIKTSFESANDLVKFVRELKDMSFSGKVLCKEKIPNREGKKKAGVFVYEIENEKIDGFVNTYYTLLDVEDSEIVLKIKKSLPKPGKGADKIDDGFCSLTISNKYWTKAKEAFFWNVPDGKKAEVSYNLQINEIIIPKGEKDPIKMRENAIRKGKIIQIISIDGSETKKEASFEA